MTIQDIFMASAVLFGLLLGVLLGWYGCLAYAKRKYVDNEPTPPKPKNKKHTEKPKKKSNINQKSKPTAESTEPEESKVDLKRIIKDREVCSFTDFRCEEEGTDSLETLRQNQQKSNLAYEFLKGNNAENS